MKAAARSRRTTARRKASRLGAAIAVSLLSVTCALADDQSTTTSIESTSSSNSTVNSSSSTNTSTTSTYNNYSPNLNNTNPENKLRTEKPSIALTPKFKKRITDIADQIDMALNKGFLNSEEAATFKQRQLQLLSMDDDAVKKGMLQTSIVEIERAITVLNADMYRAMNKANAAPLPSTDNASDKSSDKAADNDAAKSESAEKKTAADQPSTK